MSGLSHVSVPGTVDGIHEALDALEAWCDACGLASSRRRRVMTALDEVMANVVRHALGGRAGSIDVTFARDRQALVVEVADDAAPFDPLSLPAPNTTAPLDARRPGGLGLMLVRALADDVRYERRADRNHLTLTWRETDVRDDPD